MTTTEFKEYRVEEYSVQEEPFYAPTSDEIEIFTAAYEQRIPILLKGPTGVGKTEVTQQLSKLMGVELLRFDMTEYMDRHTVSRSIGAPPGYVGYDQGLRNGRRNCGCIGA